MGQSYELRIGEGTKRKGPEEEWIQPKDKKDVKCERLNEEGRARGGGAFPKSQSEPRREKEASFHGESGEAGDYSIPLRLQKK